MSESDIERDSGERRASPRRVLSFDAKVQADGAEFPARIVDASARGIYLESKTTVPRETAVDVQFVVDGHEIFLSGRVVRADVIPVGKNPGFAVEFDLDAAAVLDRLRA